MEEIAISKFKATCLAVLERVRKTHKPIRITKFGRPVAEVVPPSTPVKRRGWLGVMKGTGQIIGDIVEPASDEKDWEALNP
jgi:prevent-host-death family protein